VFGSVRTTDLQLTNLQSGADATSGPVDGTWKDRHDTCGELPEGVAHATGCFPCLLVVEMRRANPLIQFL
jgi:hypothetical protein